MIEVWRSVAGLEGLYEVSDLGRVRSVGRRGTNGVVLVQSHLSNGRLVVSLSSPAPNAGVKTAQVHRLVARAFLGESDLLVLHKDGDHTNNKASNLKYGTYKENTEDAREHGTMTRGEASPLAVLTEFEVLGIKAKLKAGESCAAIARKHNVCRTTISSIKRGKSWAHLQEPIVKL